MNWRTWNRDWKPRRLTQTKLGLDCILFVPAVCGKNSGNWPQIICPLDYHVAGNDSKIVFLRMKNSSRLYKVMVKCFIYIHACESPKSTRQKTNRSWIEKLRLESESLNSVSNIDLTEPTQIVTMRLKNWKEDICKFCDIHWNVWSGTNSHLHIVDDAWCMNDKTSLSDMLIDDNFMIIASEWVVNVVGLAIYINLYITNLVFVEVLHNLYLWLRQGFLNGTL